MICCFMHGTSLWLYIGLNWLCFSIRTVDCVTKPDVAFTHNSRPGMFHGVDFQHLEKLVKQQNNVFGATHAQ